MKIGRNFKSVALSVILLSLSAQMAGAQAGVDLNLTYAGESYSLGEASWMRAGSHIWNLTVLPLVPLVLFTTAILLFRISRHKKVKSSMLAAAIGWVGLLSSFAFMLLLRSMSGSGPPDNNSVIKILDKNGWWPIWGFTTVVYVAVVYLTVRVAIVSSRRKEGRDQVSDPKDLADKTPAGRL